MTPSPLAAFSQAAPSQWPWMPPDVQTACSWAAAVAPEVAMLKVGLETYLRDGAEGIAAIREAAGDLGGRRWLFLDLKLHDIPNTVAGGARSVARFDPALLTVHALGGPEMVRAAADALPDTYITAITVLTSMDTTTMATVGLAGTPADAAVRLAEMAVGAGARPGVFTVGSGPDPRGGRTAGAVGDAGCPTGRRCRGRSEAGGDPGPGHRRRPDLPGHRPPDHRRCGPRRGKCRHRGRDLVLRGNDGRISLPSHG